MVASSKKRRYIIDKQAKVQVNGIWRGDFVKIYAIQNPKDTSFVPLLLFYSHDKDPHFTRQQTMTIEDVETTYPYKVKRFYSWDDVPDDVSATF